MTKRAIGIDLGCTNIKAVLIDEQGTILDQDRTQTNEQDNQYWKKSVNDFIQNFKRKSRENIDGIGLCAPGLANIDNTCIVCMPGRLPGLENFVWSDFVKEKIWVLNDAHAALTAESTFGAAKGMQHIVMLTLGSGVGGGILINGQLYQGMAQMAGHFGHTTVDANVHDRDVTNMPGSIEDAIGNITIVQRSHGQFKTTLELIEAYKRGETFATWLWLSSVRKLSISIASAINMLSPEVVIIGGGIGQAEEALMKPLTNFLELYEWRPGGKQTPLRLATFSDMAGAIGAAGFALSKIKNIK
ncbi:MAG: ROK family protein [Cyclobacteriaceae bacterium]